MGEKIYDYLANVGGARNRNRGTGEAAILYFHLAHRKFIHTTVSDNVPIYFIGSNMAARAFETAMVGGINKAPGGEDYALARTKQEAMQLLKINFMR